MIMTNGPIPSAVLELLRQRWKPTEEGYSSFESQWNERENSKERQSRPSFYIYQKSTGDSANGFQALKLAEVKALAKLDAFAPMILEKSESYAVNEHLEHAIADFCSQVYDAFDQLQQRAEEIAAKQRTPE